MFEIYEWLDEMIDKIYGNRNNIGMRYFEDMESRLSGFYSESSEEFLTEEDFLV
jgi:hypothetical protein